MFTDREIDSKYFPNLNKSQMTQDVSNGKETITEQTKY